MKTAQFKKLLLATFWIFGLLVMGVPQISQAAKQPVGKVPVLEPLQPAPEGIKPNYSKNIQDTGRSSAQPTEQANSETTPATVATKVVASAKSHKLIWGIVILFILIGLVYGLLKGGVISFLPVILALLVLPAFAPKAQAQSLPSSGPVIQRTIVDEADLPKAAPTASSQASTSVLYGLGGIILVVIAIGASMMLLGVGSKVPKSSKKK
ncbi:MAG TPA: hypothetical protein VHQ20_01855 [Patescibacteria group bacterium]|nr:hypothetical protein [Patescibacteria group bacterium]